MPYLPSISIEAHQYDGPQAIYGKWPGRGIPLCLRFMDIYRSWARYAHTHLNTLNFPSHPCMSRAACITCNRLFSRLFYWGSFITPFRERHQFLLTKYLLQLTKCNSMWESPKARATRVEREAVETPDTGNKNTKDKQSSTGAETYRILSRGGRETPKSYAVEPKTWSQGRYRDRRVNWLIAYFRIGGTRRVIFVVRPLGGQGRGSFVMRWRRRLSTFSVSGGGRGPEGW